MGAEVRAERDKRADRQEEDEVRALKDAGYIAFRIDREVDTFAAKSGVVWLCDCKFSDNGIFYIDSSDVAKGLDSAVALAKALEFKVPVGFRVDMHFPRHRSRNRHYITIRESDRGWSIRVERTVRGRFITARVKRGG